MELLKRMRQVEHVPAASLRLPQRRKRVLILGTGRLAKELGQVLAFHRRYSHEVVGFLDRDPSRIGERLVNPGIVGVFDQLFEVAEREMVDTIAVCMEDRRGRLPVEALLDCKALGMNVVDGHHMYEEETGRLSIDLVRPSTIIFSTGFRHRLLSKALKRLVDIVLSSAGLILLLPLHTILALLIKLDSPGPVFYQQTRVGLKGRPYRMWKFRTMREGAEEDGSAQWASPDDPRVTAIGRWLRKWRVDELPQFLNVLRGEMSLVGPRPERPAFVQTLRDFIPYYDLRHTIRPGITGWAQVRFRYGASAEDAHVKLQYDLYYVKNLSLVLDCRILLSTIRVVLLGAGAR